MTLMKRIFTEQKGIGFLLISVPQARDGHPQQNAGCCGILFRSDP